MSVKQPAQLVLSISLFKPSVAVEIDTEKNVANV